VLLSCLGCGRRCLVKLCLPIMRHSFESVILAVCVFSHSGSALINNNWEELEAGTTIRYFSPDMYQEGGTASEIWNDMGVDITCKVHNDLTVDLKLPEQFNTSLPLKGLTHGFSSKVSGGKTAFVDAWMKKYNREVNVILLNWPKLSNHLVVEDDEDNDPKIPIPLYDDAAYNAIDIGEYLGHCLAALTAQTGLDSSSIHLVGHSLGSHLMGKAGSTYQSVTGTENIGRVTGLDPAGPRFIDSMFIDALPYLAENKLSPESADFVDVIHTFGTRDPEQTVIYAGDINPLGHRDFYPNGGEKQPGCSFFNPDVLPDICNHRRSTYYYLHSILEEHLFPAEQCQDVSSCADFPSNSSSVDAYMGEMSQMDFDGERKLLYVEIIDEYWDYHEHH